MADRPPTFARVLGVIEMLLSIPLALLGLVVIGGVVENGLIILANAGGAYLLGRHTVSKAATNGSAVVNFAWLLLVLLISFIGCRISASGHY
jgi:hypothetical protein